MYNTCMQEPTETREGEAELQAVMTFHLGDWELNLGSLQEQQMLLIIDSSLQPNCVLWEVLKMHLESVHFSLFYASLQIGF